MSMSPTTGVVSGTKRENGLRTLGVGNGERVKESAGLGGRSSLHPTVVGFQARSRAVIPTSYWTVIVSSETA